MAIELLEQPRTGLSRVLQQATAKSVVGNQTVIADTADDVVNRPGSVPSPNPAALDLESVELARVAFGDLLTCAPPGTDIVAYCGGRSITLPRDAIALYVKPRRPLQQSPTVGVGFAYGQPGVPGAAYPDGDALKDAVGAIRFLNERLQLFRIARTAPPAFAEGPPPDGIVYVVPTTGEVVAVVPPSALPSGTIEILFHFFEAGSNDGVRALVDIGALPRLDVA